MSDLADRLRGIVQTERERFGVPGAAVLVMNKGEVVLAEGFGHRDVEADLPVTADTLMPIGSSTKTFTAALCATLVDAGRVGWDTPIREYFPAFRMKDPVAAQLLNFRDCLSHRSGLPRHDLLWYGGDGHTTRDDIVDALAHLEPSRPFRELWQYNNLLYITAGTLAGRLLGSSFEGAVSDAILKPLGMVRTNFDVAETRADGDHATPHMRDFGSDATRAVPFASLGVAGPAGNMNSSVTELIPWVRTLLGLGVDGGDPLLSAAALADLRQPTMPIPESPLGNATGGQIVGQGLGLQIQDYRGVRITAHGGNIDGFSSTVFTVAEHGIGIVVLANLHSTAMPGALPMAILDELLDLEPLAHGEKLFKTMTSVLEQMALVQAAVTGHPAGLPNVRPLAEFVGSYTHPAYGTLLIAGDDDGLTAGYRNFAAVPLMHSNLDIFRFTPDMGGQKRVWALQFLHGLEGEVEALRVPFEPEVAPIRFEKVNC